MRGHYTTDTEARKRWGDKWEACLSAYMIERNEGTTHAIALRAIDNYWDDMAAEDRQYRNQFEDEGPQVFDTMSGGSFSR